MNKKRKILLLFFTLFATSLFTSAFGANLFEPVAQDKSLYVLQQLFGGLMPNGGNDPFLAGIKIFNGAMLTIGGILAGYTVLAGTLGTAHDGEMLGKKFSSVWIPIRYSIGTSLLLPIVSGGYCVIQSIVIWLVIQGVGLADNVWSSYMTADGMKAIAASSITQPEAKKLGYNIFASLSCVYAHENVKQAILKEIPGDVFGLSKTNFGVTKEETTFGTTYSFGDKNEALSFSKEVCGVVKIPKYSVPVVSLSSGIISSVINVQDSLQKMVEANKQNVVLTGVLITSLNSVAQTQASGTVAIDLSPVEVAVSTYEKALVDNATSVIMSDSSNDMFIQAANQDGWIMAGNFFNKINSIQDLAQRSASNIPEASGPLMMENNIFSDKFSAIMTGVQKSLTASGAITSLGYGVSKLEGGSETSWTKTITDFVKKGFSAEIFIKKITNSFSKYVFHDKENPFSGCERLGSWLLMIGSALLAGLIAINIFAGGFDFGIATSIAAVITIFVPAIMMTGALLKYVIPNLPAFIFWGAVIGWAVLVVEAILASPLWIVMHLFPSGDDVTGKGGSGYSLVLSLILRPSLIIFGFIASLVMSQLFGSMINATFADLFTSSQGDSNVFIQIIGSFIFEPIIYFGFMLVMLKKCLDLIHIIPDQIMKWIGGGAEQMGHFAKSMGGAEVIAPANAASRMAGQLSGAIGQAGKSVGDKDSGSAGSELNKLGDSFAQQESAEGSENNPGGDNSLSAMKKQSEAKAKFNEAVSNLGGADSQAGKSFASDLSNRMSSDPSTPASSHFNSAMNKAVSQQYGFGSGAVAAEMGGGYSGEKFGKAVSMYSQTAQALSDNGMSGNAIKDQIGKANKSAYSDFKNSSESTKNGGNKSISDFAQAHLGKLKDSAKLGD